MLSAPPVAALPRLTPREVAVIRLVAQGLTNAQIAVALGISLHTVRSHLEHVQVKVQTDPEVDQRWLVRLAYVLAKAECALEAAA